MKHSQQPIQFSLTEVEKIISGTEEAIFIVDPKNGKIILLNDSAKKVAKKGKNFFCSLPTLYSHPRNKKISIETLVTSIHPDEKETILVRDSNKTHFYEIQIDEIRISQTKLVVFVKMRDITHRITTREEALRFVHSIGHELKQPLSLIKAYTYYITKGLEASNTKVLEYPQKIDQQVDILTEMLNDIVETTKLSNQETTLQLEKIELSDWLKNLISNIKTAFPKRKIATKIEKNLVVTADTSRLRQALMNLSLNALNYSAEDSTITISAKKTVKGIEIAVKDHGIGISKKELAEIFKAYFRTTTSKQKAPKGLGLGLPLVKEIAKLHNAEISVDSTPNKGTTITLTFPNKD